MLVFFFFFCWFLLCHKFILPNFADKLDQKVHMAAAKALQRIARIRSEEEKAE